MGRRIGLAAEAMPLRRVKVGGFTLTEGVHRHGTELPWHHHETPTICFVLKGAFTEMRYGGSIACTSSTLKSSPPASATATSLAAAMRIERAASQLADTDLSPAKIAAAAGFSDQSHFSNLFRRRTCLSPFQFRRAVRST